MPSHVGSIMDHVAILVALALLDPDDHPLAVDVGDLERDHLAGAQARPIAHAQSRLVLEPGCGIEEARNLFRAEHHWQLARLAIEMGVPARTSKFSPSRRSSRTFTRSTSIASERSEEQTSELQL